MNAKTNNPSKTVLTISIGFLIVFLSTKWTWAISVSLIVGLAGVISDYLSSKIDFVWMKLTWALSLIVPNILLGLLFYMLIFPLSILAKVFRKKDPLMVKGGFNSTYIELTKQFNKESFENTW